jgi:hypothetical protein
MPMNLTRFCALIENDDIIIGTRQSRCSLILLWNRVQQLDTSFDDQVVIIAIEPYNNNNKKGCLILMKQPFYQLRIILELKSNT